jgi:hypothetical protein
VLPLCEAPVAIIFTNARAVSTRLRGSLKIQALILYLTSEVLTLRSINKRIGLKHREMRALCHMLLFKFQVRYYCLENGVACPELLQYSALYHT